MQRQVKPEWLDWLPSDDLASIRSRRDLRRVNRWMGHPRILTRALRASANGQPLRVLVDLGTGDGHFMSEVARGLRPPAKGARALLLDRVSLMSPETEAAFGQAGWRAEPIQGDAFGWLRRAESGVVDALVANLFLHHFTNDQLRELFSLAVKRAPLLVAVEPRRSFLALLCTRLLWAIGCNAVTRHDAVVSVRAGFSGRELASLWPSRPLGQWEITEGPAGCFSHLFIAKRTR
jgi:hypothetical protein